jgi:hypothetical protein
MLIWPPSLQELAHMLISKIPICDHHARRAWGIRGRWYLALQVSVGLVGFQDEEIARARLRDVKPQIQYQASWGKTDEEIVAEVDKKVI